MCRYRARISRRQTLCSEIGSKLRSYPTPRAIRTCACVHRPRSNAWHCDRSEDVDKLATCLTTPQSTLQHLERPGGWTTVALGHDSSLLWTSPTLWDCTAAASQVVKSYAAPPIQPAQRLVTRFRPAGCGMMWPRHLIVRSRGHGFRWRLQ